MTPLQQARAARNAEIVALKAELSTAEIAALFGLGASTIHAILHEAGVALRRGKAVRNAARDAAIASARSAGKTVGQISLRRGITPQRVTQICGALHRSPIEGAPA